MWIKIICFIFIFYIFIHYKYYMNRYYINRYYINRYSKINISHKMEDFPLLFDNTIACIHLKDFYPKEYCDILLKRIKIINEENIKPWRYSDTKHHDVSIFQTPLSDVFNNLKSPEEYFNQMDWNLYEGLPSPIDYFIEKYQKQNECNIQKNRDDCIIEQFPKYKAFENNFLESIVRIYKPNTFHIDGLRHIDIDETGYYNDYHIYSINIYLQVPKDGGELIIENTKIKPSIGDVIVFNPSYTHSVRQSTKENRISIQSFILYHKKNKENKKKKKLFIRV